MHEADDELEIQTLGHSVHTRQYQNTLESPSEHNTQPIYTLNSRHAAGAPRIQSEGHFNASIRFMDYRTSRVLG